MTLNDIRELLGKYDKLRSIANSGSSDKSITSSAKIIRRIYGYKLLKKYSINTYTIPFASYQIRNEIRASLTHILKLHEINYLRSNREDKTSKEAIDIIKDYLKEIPKHGLSFTDRLKSNSWNILAFSIGVLSLIASTWSTGIPFVLLIIGVLFVVPVVVQQLLLGFIMYFVERRWKNKWMNNLAIQDLKDKIVNPLVDLNDKSYSKLDT